MNAKQARFLADHYVNVLETEFATTCKVLEAIPDGRRDYKPDDKSRSAWDVAKHLATSEIFFLNSVLMGQFVVDPEASKQVEAQFKTVGDVVAFYKKAFQEKIKDLRVVSAEVLAKNIDFFGITKKPAAEFLSLANNHSIHHRGQLAAYLRAMGSKVPAIYGGSADEPMGEG
jgi:uncharacterized damage-inducible protein DinB